VAMVSVACLRGPGCGASPLVGVAACAGNWLESDGGAIERSPPRKSAGVPRLAAATRRSFVRRISGGGGGSFISCCRPGGPVALLVNRAVAIEHQFGFGCNLWPIRGREVIREPHGEGNYACLLVLLAVLNTGLDA